MKSLLTFICVLICSSAAFAQESQTDYFTYLEVVAPDGQVMMRITSVDSDGNEDLRGNANFFENYVLNYCDHWPEFDQLFENERVNELRPELVSQLKDLFKNLELGVYICAEREEETEDSEEALPECPSENSTPEGTADDVTPEGTGTGLESKLRGAVFKTASAVGSLTGCRVGLRNSYSLAGWFDRLVSPAGVGENPYGDPGSCPCRKEVVTHAAKEGKQLVTFSERCTGGCKPWAACGVDPATTPRCQLFPYGPPSPCTCSIQRAAKIGVPDYGCSQKDCESGNKTCYTKVLKREVRISESTGVETWSSRATLEKITASCIKGEKFQATRCFCAGTCPFGSSFETDEQGRPYNMKD